MSARKNVVETYIEGFRRTDRELIHSCLTDDVVWEMPDFFTARGRSEFDGQIENEDTPGRPELTIDRLVEEGDTVVAVGAVRASLTTGGVLEAVFCDVFTFRGERICRLETYQVMLSGPPVP